MSLAKLSKERPVQRDVHSSAVLATLIALMSTAYVGATLTPSVAAVDDARGQLSGARMFENRPESGGDRGLSPMVEGGPVGCNYFLVGTAHSGQAPVPSTFYRIDPTTAAATAVGPIGFDSVSAIDLDPKSGILYGVGRRPSDNESVLITIDPATGAGTEVGPTGVGAFQVGFNLSDISFRESDGTLFGFVESGNGVVILDTATGGASLVGVADGVPGCCGSGVAFSLAEVLYHADDGGLSTLNPATGAATFVASLVYQGFPTFDFARANGLEFHPLTGVVYASINDGAQGSGPNYLATLDPSSAAVVNLGQSVDGLDALAWVTECGDADPCTYDLCVADCLLFGAGAVDAGAESTLYQVDATTGTSTSIGAVGFDKVLGMDFHPWTGTLYAVARRAAPAPPVDVLITIDRETGAGAEVGPLVNTSSALEGGHFDLSFRSDGTLYLTAYSVVNPCVSVFTVDLSSGTATEIGDTTTCDDGNALGFSLIDDLFHATDGARGSLFSTDAATGVSTLTTSLSFVGFPDLSEPRPIAMDFDPCAGGTRVSVADGSGAAPAGYLAALDPVTGELTHLGSTIEALEALAGFDPGDAGTCFHETVPDFDLDDLCDPIDNCPQAYNPDQGPATFDQTVIFISKDDLYWGVALDVVIVRGPFTTPVDIASYAFDVNITGVVDGAFDGTSPPDGEGLWYLVKPNCSAGIWSSGGPGEVPGGRDAALP
jgi:hypothetical protein